MGEGLGKLFERLNDLTELLRQWLWLLGGGIDPDVDAGSGKEGRGLARSIDLKFYNEAPGLQLSDPGVNLQDIVEGCCRTEVATDVGQDEVEPAFTISWYG